VWGAASHPQHHPIGNQPYPQDPQNIFIFFVTFFLFLQLIIIEGNLLSHPTKDKEQNTPSKGQKNGLDTK
jgi:hypothetical protein